MIWLNSDIIGIVVGLVAFLIMIIGGWANEVPVLTSVERALIGLLVGYIAGFFFSSRIRMSVTRMMVEDKIRKEEEQQAASSKDTSAEGDSE